MELETLGRTRYVCVTNNGETSFTDRFDGVPVTIEAGSSDNLPLDMAAHFFGYHDNVTQEEMFRHICKRQGWNTPAHLKEVKGGKTLARSLFEKLEIKPKIFKLVEEKQDLDAPIPADPQPEELPRRRKAS